MFKWEHLASTSPLLLLFYEATLYVSGFSFRNLLLLVLHRVPLDISKRQCRTTPSLPPPLHHHHRLSSTLSLLSKAEYCGEKKNIYLDLLSYYKKHFFFAKKVEKKKGSLMRKSTKAITNCSSIYALKSH